MASFDFDLFVIGAGSAGVRCARIAASLGARVAIAENRYLGGTCVNVGCVPKKMFVYASEFAHEFEAAKGFGWSVQTQGFDWPAFIAAKDKEIERLNTVYANILENSGAEILNGSATLMGQNQVSVDGKVYSSDKVVIAVGGWPNKGDYPGAEYTITSNEIFSLSEQPKRVLVEGGGLHSR